MKLRSAYLMPPRSSLIKQVFGEDMSRILSRADATRTRFTRPTARRSTPTLVN